MIAKIVPDTGRSMWSNSFVGAKNPDSQAARLQPCAGRSNQTWTWPVPAAFS